MVAMYLQQDPSTLKKVTARRVLAVYWKALSLRKGTFFLTLFTIVLGSATDVVAPIFYKKFFDTVTGQNLIPSSIAPILINIICIVLAIHIIGWVCWRIATFATSYYQAYTMALLKSQAFGYIIQHSHTFFVNNFVGSIVQRVNRHAKAFETIADNLSWNLLPLFIQIIGTVTVLFIENKILAIIVFAWGAVFILFNYFFARWKLKYDIAKSVADSKTTGVLADSFTNNSNITLFASHELEHENLTRITEDQAKVTNFSWNLGNIVEAVQAGLILTTEFFIFYFAIGFWARGEISVGTFVLVQAYVISLAHSLWNFGRVIRSFYEAFADSKELVEIIDTPHEIQDISSAIPLLVKEGKVEFKNVTFNYNETRSVLSGVSFAITPGEKVALIGPSGAGKSTIVRLLLRLHDLTDGHIFIDAQDIKDTTHDSLHKAIALVPQEPMLFHRTLRENIRYGKPEATDGEVEEAARLSHSDEFIENLPHGYETYVGERGVKLSGGERQRVAIARAILKNAPILVLDEATSSLDSHSESLIQDALEELMRGKTTIVIAHRLSTIRKMDRIIVLKHGKIIEEGTHEKLLKKRGSLYKKLWNLQAGGFGAEAKKII